MIMPNLLIEIGVEELPVGREAHRIFQLGHGNGNPALRLYEIRPEIFSPAVG